MRAMKVRTMDSCDKPHDDALLSRAMFAAVHASAVTFDQDKLSPDARSLSFLQ